jgi:hypothetical protein
MVVDIEWKVVAIANCCSGDEIALMVEGSILREEAKRTMRLTQRIKVAPRGFAEDFPKLLLSNAFMRLRNRLLMSLSRKKQHQKYTIPNSKLWFCSQLFSLLLVCPCPENGSIELPLPFHLSETLLKNFHCAFIFSLYLS